MAHIAYQRPAHLLSTIQSDKALVATQYSTYRRSSVTHSLGRRIGALFFRLFLIAQFVSLGRSYFVDNFNERFAELATNMTTVSLVLILLSLWGYSSTTGHPFGYLLDRGRAWVILMSMIVLSLFFYGWLYRGYNINPVVRETGVYLILISCVILGSFPQFWKDTDRAWIILFLIGLTINVWGLTDITSLLSKDGYNARSGIESQSYDTQSLLHIWPFLLLTARQRKPLTLFFILTGVLFVLGQQLLFQKRIGVTQVIICLLIFFVVLPIIAKRWLITQIISEGAIRFWFLILVILGLCFGIVAAPEILTGQTSSLLRRYSTKDESRVGEALGMLQSLEGIEYVVGRGMGGYFKYIDSNIVEWGNWLADVGTVGRREMHVGALMPVLKGGLLFASIYYLGIVYVLLSIKSNISDPVCFAAYTLVLIVTLFSFQGGQFIMSSAYEVTMLGLCIGRCLTKNIQS